MTINPRTIATRARHRLKTISDVLDRLADEGPVAYHLADEWSGGVSSLSTGRGSRGSTIARPTEQAAINGGADEARAVAAMYADLVLIHVLTGQLEVVAGRVDTNLAKWKIYEVDTPRSGVESLADLNRTDGLCPTCEKTNCTGQGGDRLRCGAVAEGERRRMCDSCRKAWTRRGYDEDDRLTSYSSFRRERRRR